ncbi:MAG: hypothetical protein ACM3ZA_13600 [Bacillota bacterium]
MKKLFVLLTVLAVLLAGTPVLAKGSADKGSSTKGPIIGDTLYGPIIGDTLYGPIIGDTLYGHTNK